MSRKMIMSGNYPRDISVSGNLLSVEDMERLASTDIRSFKDEMYKTNRLSKARSVRLRAEIKETVRWWQDHRGSLV